MIIPQGVIESIDTNNVEISAGWLWCSVDVYSMDYNTVLSQPISVEAVVLNELRFLADTATLTIRRTSVTTSGVLWSGDIETEPDPFVPDPDPDPPCEVTHYVLESSGSTTHEVFANPLNRLCDCTFYDTSGNRFFAAYRFNDDATQITVDLNPGRAFKLYIS